MVSISEIFKSKIPTQKGPGFDPSWMQTKPDYVPYSLKLQLLLCSVTVLSEFSNLYSNISAEIEPIFEYAFWARLKKNSQHCPFKQVNIFNFCS